MTDTGAAASFHLAGPEIISETFDDGESVVVNLENGFYFSLNEVGGVAFELLAAEAPLGEVATTLGERFEAPPETIREAVGEFALRLVDEGLLRPGASPLPPPAPNGRAHLPPDTRQPFEAPTVTAYTDMQDLLLADPIHDYDETGWPARVDDR